MARLRIEFRGAETVVPLAAGETTVGRSNLCTIHLPDPALGEVHFRIRARTKGYQLKDDGSGAGTRVNGKPVYATTLAHGDVIQAGGLTCHFLVEATAPPPVRAMQPEEMVLARAERARPKRAAPNSALVWGGIVAVAAVVAVVLLLRESPEKKAQAAWFDAKAPYDASLAEDPAAAEKSLADAVRRLDDVRTRFDGTKTARSVARNLEDARRALDALRSLEAERAAMSQPRDPDGVAAAFARIARLDNVPHPAVRKRVAAVEEELKLAGVARQETEFAAIEARALALAQDKKYAEALRVWDGFEAAEYGYRRRAAESRDGILKRIAAEYRSLLRLASRSGEIDGRIGLLEASRAVFRGTPQAEDLEVRISALHARKRRTAVVILDPPRKKKPDPDKTVPTPDQPVADAPYEDPPHVVELAKQRRYAEAAAKLHEVSRHPDAKVRVEEFTLIANVLADLVGAIQAKPDAFTSILLPKGVGRGDLLGADEKGVDVMAGGAKTRYGWDALPAKSYVKLFRLCKFEQPTLGVALFFDEEMLPKEAQREYVLFHKSEQAPTTLTRILTRRRGLKSPPPAGFEVFRGALVTADERERTLLLENVAKLGKQARSTNDKRRRDAWAELEKIGDPAIETLTGALRERRANVVQELLGSKAFTAARFAAKFGRELEDRRKAALAFILDPSKYPYPNKSEAAQAEAERLVGRVQELWEKPYAALLSTSDKAQALDAELKELDGKLAKYDPLGEPAYDSAVEAVQAKLDTSRISLGDDKRIAYYFDALKYNEKVKTTADSEEKDNVLAVNEYRHMMGLYAVKIDERLVRAARKHSIEMMQDNYFAHESPTPHLRNPGQRAKREGYGGGVAENIARGASTGRQVFWQWYRSSGHHRNMLNPGHTELGCGACKHHWWTQKFGRMTGRRLQEPDVPRDPDPPGASGNGKPAPKQ